MPIYIIYIVFLHFGYYNGSMSKHQIKELIEKRISTDGIVETGIDGVRLFRVTEPVRCSPAVYEPVVVAIVSLGGPRKFLLRPKGGGRSRSYALASGDLLVMGGACQRSWEHSVPKAASAPPRMSVTFRHTRRASDRASGSAPASMTRPLI